MPPIIRAIRVALAVLLTVGVGLLGLSKMVHAELHTDHNFSLYFHWALGAGLVFLAVGFALTFYDSDDSVATSFDDVTKQ